jgi:DNA anti-recombination protein RmuC
MAQQASFIDEGIDQVKEAFSNVGDEFEKLQKNLEKRRKRFEKETEKRVKKFEKSSFGKRIVSFREDTQKQIESNVESLLSLFPVASSAQIKRLERKVTTLTRKVNALEKASAAKARTALPTAVKAEAQASA